VMSEHDSVYIWK